MSEIINNNQEKKEKIHPVKKFKSGHVSASMWANSTQTKNGDTMKFFSFTFQKNFKDKDDQWKNSESFSEFDMPNLAVVVQKINNELTKTEDHSSKSAQ